MRASASFALLAAALGCSVLGCADSGDEAVTRRGGDDTEGSRPGEGEDGGTERPDLAFRNDGGDPGASQPDGGASEPPDAGAALTYEERDLLDAINAERAAGGLAPVSVDDRLLCAARRHALDVGGSGTCGHVGSDGSWPWDRAVACGFPQPEWTVNEIAAGPGFTDGADAVWGWRQSSGHYAALMHPSATTVGVAVHATCFIALFDCCVAGSE